MRGTQVSRIFVSGTPHARLSALAQVACVVLHHLRAPIAAHRVGDPPCARATPKLLAFFSFSGAGGRALPRTAISPRCRPQARGRARFIVIGAFILTATMAPMSNDTRARTPIAAAGVVCFRDDDVVLVRRGKAPMEDHWSLPGGRIEWGERAADAARRELKEETGCDAELIGLIDVVDALPASRASGHSPPWGHYVLVDYAARWRSGEPRGADDAREARFFSPGEITGLGLWSETIRIIEAARRMR